MNEKQALLTAMITIRGFIKDKAELSAAIGIRTLEYVNYNKRLAADLVVEILLAAMKANGKTPQLSDIEPILNRPNGLLVYSALCAAAAEEILNCATISLTE